jgi:hypothetical protein
MAYWARVTLTVAGALLLLLAAWRVRNILLLVLVAAVFAVGLDRRSAGCNAGTCRMAGR